MNRILGPLAKGDWLFRWRSYIPLGVIAVALPSLPNFHYPLGSHALDEMWEVFCLVISLTGLGMRIAAAGCVPKGTSGRNTRRQTAANLNTTGLYSVVRHPLYFGNFLIWLGISLILRQWWLSATAMLIFLYCYWRIVITEESFLRERFGSEFDAWAQQTPALYPKLTGWRRSDLPFSVRTAIRREYLGLLAIITAFTGFEVACDFVVEHRIIPETPWLVAFSATLVLCGVLRFLSKHTDVLRVEGR